MERSKHSNRIAKILVIDDDEEMRSLLKDFAEEEGYEADSVEKGTYALKKLITESFDLIITDIRMPGFSGLEILPELKKLQPTTPIVVITAFGGEEVYHKALSRGADAYLEKPVHLSKLRKLIHEMTSSKEKGIRR
jgi:DNA-binding response OmpR family regulator